MASLRYRAFALELSADQFLPGLHGDGGRGGGPVTYIRHTSRDEIEDRWDAATARRLWSGRVDGESTLLERDGRDGHLLRYGERACYLIAPGVDRILCAEREDDPGCTRFLLDTVLLVASQLAGFEALHASAVDRRDGVVALLSETGGGKSTTAIELVRRGYPLFCDDILAIEAVDGVVQAHPGPALMNVPAGVDPASLGEPLAVLGDETWVAVRRACAHPRPLAALVLLERRAGATEELQRLPAQPIPLLPHTVGSLTWSEHARRRFELLSELAASVPLYRLEADLHASPERIADLVEGVGLVEGALA